MEKQGNESGWASASHLYDPVPFLDPSLDRRAARSDILNQLNPLAADGEAKAQLVLLHDHTSLDKTGTWERRTLQPLAALSNDLKLDAKNKP